MQSAAADSRRMFIDSVIYTWQFLRTSDLLYISLVTAKQWR